VTLKDNFSGAFLALGLAREGEIDFWLAIGNLVDARICVRTTKRGRRHETENTPNHSLVARIKPGRCFSTSSMSFRFHENINHDHFPIDFALLQQGHDAENLDLLNLSDISNPFADFADVERVIVTLGLGLSVSLCWVFPGLPKRSQR
jgi:hypothetical protein